VTRHRSSSEAVRAAPLGVIAALACLPRALSGQVPLEVAKLLSGEDDLDLVAAIGSDATVMREHEPKRINDVFARLLLGPALTDRPGNLGDTGDDPAVLVRTSTSDDLEG
jgi:hypothetical protein